MHKAITMQERRAAKAATSPKNASVRRSMVSQNLSQQFTLYLRGAGLASDAWVAPPSAVGFCIWSSRPLDSTWLICVPCGCTGRTAGVSSLWEAMVC